MITKVRDLSYWMLFVSIALHFVAIVSIPRSRQNRESEKWVELERVAPDSPLDNSKDKPPVFTARSQEKESEEPVRFGGEFRNRTSKQTKAAKQGAFRHGARLSGGPVQKSGDEKAVPFPGELLQESAQPYELPDIAEGDETILNTDPVVYASFMNRITEEIYDPWVSALHQFAEGKRRKGVRVEPNLYRTRLQVTFDEGGEIVAIHTLKSSGVNELDEIARDVFWSREPFPNPPKLGRNSDNYLTINYEFALNWELSFFQIIPVRL